MSDREHLTALVNQWNENRLELFHLSQPTEELEIEGVMRFYFQDQNERVITKCVRVSSTATTRAVVEALADKFLPDLKMLTDNQYSLWEVQENGWERRLEDEEKPLLVQLTWHRDDKEGRFLLRRDQLENKPLSVIQLQEADNMNGDKNRYSKKEKKEVKKKHRDIVTLNGGVEDIAPLSDIYRQLPSNTFTRTISNPEVVMKKRREKKVEDKLKQIYQEHGGSVKVFGSELNPSKPYVTILVSINDTAEKVLFDALEKYGQNFNIDDYVLVETSDDGTSENDRGERMIKPEECPLRLVVSRADPDSTKLCIRSRTDGYRGVSTSSSAGGTLSRVHLAEPALLPLQASGSPSSETQRVALQEGVTEVGCDPQLAHFAANAQNIILTGPEVCGRHCVIAYTDGVVTITPSNIQARIEVNGVRIGQTVILQHDDVIVIGRTHLFRFICAPSGALGVSTSNYSEYSSIPQTSLTHSISGSSSVSSRPPNDQMGAPPYGSSIATKDSGAGNGGAVNMRVSLQIGDYKVWDYLVEVISRGWSDSSTFRLSPAYALYLALRFFHIYSKPYLVQFFTRIGHHLNQIAQECTSRDELLFWLANASELSFLVETDPDLKSPRSSQLGSVVESLFRRLCLVTQGSLRPACQSMADQSLSTEEGVAELITVLDGMLRTARASRLNLALTIQLCSHCFHYVNSTLFNSLVTRSGNRTGVQLTTRLGRCLQGRLAALHRWSETMGVELASECHLDRTRQAAALLAAQKNDISALGQTCYKLNSQQVRYLLTHFEVENGEIPCDVDVLNRVVGLAERQADQLAIQDGQIISLEESDELSLPFILPQDGYAAETLKSTPEGLTQYLLRLQDKGLCHSVKESSGNSPKIGHTNSNTNAMQVGSGEKAGSMSSLTTIPTSFGDSIGSTSSEEVIRVVLKRSGGGIGLSIVAAQGIGDRHMGIYVKKVVEGSPAAINGHLAAGDQLLSVNGASLIGISQEEAAQQMGRSGTEVRLDVKKGAAHRNGLAGWLNPQQNGMPGPSQTSGSLHSLPQGGQQQQLPSYANYASVGSKMGSQTSVQPPSQSYQQRHPQVAASRSSAFAPPTTAPTTSTETAAPRHARSISASDLYQYDPNSSMSQRSLTSVQGGFDRLPSHYRQSHRPTVIQPSRTCPSPTALRRSAQSPTSLYRPPSVTGLQRPPSVTNLFAPPKSPTPLQQQGYSSGALRDSNHDLYRATMPSPIAASSPRQSSDSIGVHHGVGGDSHGGSGFYQPQPSSHYSSLPLVRPNALPFSSTTSKPSGSNNLPPRAAVEPVQTTFSHREPAAVRVEEDRRDMGRPHGSVTPSISQALAQEAAWAEGAPSRVVRAGGGSRVAAVMHPDERLDDMLQSTLMTRESVHEELDRLDSKGFNMTLTETKRYRELLNMAAEQSRQQRQSVERDIPVQVLGVHQQQRRTETLIDDVDATLSAAVASSENISPGTSRREAAIRASGGKSVQWDLPSTASDKNEYRDDVIDSPGIVGSNEVYRDPRQRRLNDLQQRDNQTVREDGSRLDFRDKMRLFATQIGEGTPKQKTLTSSAERFIAHESS